LTEFSDYIVYVDESGDHGLHNINREYPVFVLSFCVFDKQAYSRRTVPALIDLKFRFFGHDMVVLHERDIRQQKGAFGILRNRDVRERFLAGVNEFVANAEFTLIAVAIRKSELVGRYAYPGNPYEIAMKYGLERVYALLQSKGQAGERETTIVFEKRGAVEDRDLELEFRRVCDGNNWQGVHFPFKIRMASKKCNSCGLQLADLTARPIGQHCLSPDNGSRAFGILEPKLFRVKGTVSGWGLKVFPQ
jgi:hypothetical protein